MCVCVFLYVCVLGCVRYFFFFFSIGRCAATNPFLRGDKRRRFLNVMRQDGRVFGRWTGNRLVRINRKVLAWLRLQAAPHLQLRPRNHLGRHGRGRRECRHRHLQAARGKMMKRKNNKKAKQKCFRNKGAISPTRRYREKGSLLPLREHTGLSGLAGGASEAAAASAATSSAAVDGVTARLMSRSKTTRRRTMT